MYEYVIFFILLTHLIRESRIHIFFPSYFPCLILDGHLQLDDDDSLLYFGWVAFLIGHRIGLDNVVGYNINTTFSMNLKPGKASLMRIIGR